MLAELALYALTPADAMTRRLGLVGEGVALWARGRRQRLAWEPHHERCRAIVAAVIAELPRRRQAVVLGSGPARDVPLELMSRSFEEVLLVDAVHLPGIRLRAARRRNVRLLTRDLSGVMGWLAGRTEGRADPLADLSADAAVDLVVSANLASQLAWPVADWLADHPARAAALPADLPRRCIAWHLDDLSRFGGRVCLIGDVAATESGRDGRTLERLDLMHGLALPPHDDAWDWTVAPFGEAAPDRRTVHAVRAWRDWAAASGGKTRYSGP